MEGRNSIFLLRTTCFGGQVNFTIFNFQTLSKEAYIFRGSPASGKGTITELLIKEFTSKTALLELDTFRWGFHYTNRKIADISNDEHAFAFNNLLSLLDNYSKNGQYNLIIEGLFSWSEHCPHGTMQKVIEVLNRNNFKYKMFLLSGELETLLDRNAKREYSVPREEFQELYDYVMEEKRPKEIIIDVTHKNPQETLQEIKKHIFPST